MMFWWSEDEESFLRSESCGMQSKALEKSMATAVVIAGGLSSLNPSAIAADSRRSDVVVECLDLKPCWEGWVGREDFK